MNRFNFAEVRQKLLQTRRELLVLLSNQAQNYFVSSWQKQGFDGKSWKEVQRRTPGTKSYKYPKSKGLQRRSSPILVGSGYKVRGGTLRREVSTMARTAQIKESGFRMVVNSDYAIYHNEGTPKMAQRRFVGQTNELTEMQKRTIAKVVDKMWEVH